MSSKRSLEVTVDIVGRISVVRGQRVLLDSDLAVLYGVTTKRLNEQVRRNADRFPADFAFRLTEEEAVSLRSHFATLDAGRGKYSKYRPWAFTEHGAIMELKRSVAHHLDADTKRQFDQVYEAILGLMGTSVRRQ
jgi:hypothetical protein